MPPSPPHRKVLLAVTAAHPYLHPLEAACALCRRMGAGLEIVCLRGSRPDDDLDAAMLAMRADGLDCQRVERPDWDAEDLVDWANARACVAAVVAPGAEHQAEPWRRLDCPLVLAGREHEEPKQSEMK